MCSSSSSSIISRHRQSTTPFTQGSTQFEEKHKEGAAFSLLRDHPRPTRHVLALLTISFANVVCLRPLLALGRTRQNEPHGGRGGEGDRGAGGGGRPRDRPPGKGSRDGRLHDLLDSHDAPAYAASGEHGRARGES